MSKSPWPVSAGLVLAIAIATPTVGAQACPPNTRADYCTAVGDVCFQGQLRYYVSLVSFGSIQNSTPLTGPLCPPGFRGYSDFRGQVGTVAAGTRVTLTVGIDVASRFGLHGATRAYIDWNGNRVFEDPSEAIDVPPFDLSRNPWLFRTTVQVPRDAVASTVMRVGFSHPGPNPPCGAFFGDCEDYTIRVLGGRQPEFQVNQTNAVLDIDGRVGTPFCYHSVTVQAPTTLALRVGTGLPGAPFCLALTPDLPVPSSAGGIRTPGGQDWNLPFSPRLEAVCGLGSAPTTLTIPALVPFAVSLQAFVLDAANADGLAVTQPIALIVR